MKKFYGLMILSVVSYFTASAQYNKGSIYIDGSLNYNNTNLKFEDNTNYPTKSGTFIFSPNIGYFLSNNFVVGVGVEYQALTSSYPYGFFYFTNKSNELAPSIFAKYIVPISEKLSLSLKMKFSHGLVTDQIIFNGIDSTTTNVNYTEKPSLQTNRFNFSPELQYLITNSIGLQVNFTGLSINSVPKINPGYNYDGTKFTSLNVKGTETSTSFNINPSSWSVGLFIILGGGKESK